MYSKFNRLGVRYVDDDNILHDDDELEVEAIEAYCVRCREMVEMEDPLPVWTRKGMPATRGDCPICGGTVFRMGKTHAHVSSSRPAAVNVGTNKRKRPKLPQDTIYVNFALEDELMAEQLADDLRKMGVAVWLHEHEAGENHINWAGGVHPALSECARMVYVLSPNALTVGSVEAAVQFFKDKRKPIVIAQVASAEPPDKIRRSPRFDLAGDYKTAFRQMMQALSQ
jgi:hypothetical protein